MKPIVFEYRPNPVFEPFHASTAKDRAVVGGYGSGKSVASTGDIIAWGLEQPGSEFLVTRKTVPALRDTTEKTFMEHLPPALVEQCKITRAGGHLNTLQLPTGSLYYFRGMDDWKKLRSLNLAGILWDEADEFTREDYEGMQSRVRQTRPTPEARALGYTTITRRGNIVSCNPQGHNWIWEDFHPDSPQRKTGTELFVSTSFDNPYLPPEYFDRLLAMPEPWIRRYVLCSFDEFAGAVYPEWSWETHVVEPYRNNRGEYTYDSNGLFRMGFDPGTSAGNAGVWVYWDRKTTCYVAVAEYNETGLSVTGHVAAWRKIEAQQRMRVQQRIGDPKAVTQRDRGSNMKLSDQYARLGYYFQLGPGGVDDRVAALGDLIPTNRFKVTKECPRLYQQLLNYRWEDLTPLQIAKGREAKPLKKDVDLVDAAQYAVSQYVAPAKVEPTEEDPEKRRTLDTHAKIRKQLEAKSRRSATRAHDLGGMSL